MAVNTKVTKEAEEVLHTLQDFTERMGSFERAFVDDMLERFDRWGEETFVSEKQLAWLRRLEEKYA